MPLPLPNMSLTLDQLEGVVWGEPGFQSHLVVECHRLRRIPLREFTPANLRIMIGQNIGLEHLVPLALQALADDPLLDAELYAGDLFSALVRSDRAFWSAHPDLRAKLASIVDEATSRYYALDECDREISESAFLGDLSQFQRSA